MKKKKKVTKYNIRGVKTRKEREKRKRKGRDRFLELFFSSCDHTGGY